MFDFEPDNSPAATLRRMLMLLIAALVVAFGIAAKADSVRLYDQIGVEGAEVTLGQIAELQGPAARALSAVVVGTLGDGRSELELSVNDVEDAMDKAGVNWGLVSLRGYSVCQVTRLAPPPDPIVDRGQTFAANIQTPIGLETTLTLRGLVEQRIAELAGVPLSELRLGFSQRDTRELDLAILGQSVEVEPTALNRLGRVPVTVRLYEAGRVSKTLHISAKAERRMLTVVAAEPIGRGDLFTRSNLEVRERYIDDDSDVPITDPLQIVGQQSSSAMRPGEVVFVDRVKSPVMVKRGELVTVRCVVGSLVVRTIGRAGENGAIDDVIMIRNEATGESFHATVAGRREAVVFTHPTMGLQRSAAIDSRDAYEVAP